MKSRSLLVVGAVLLMQPPAYAINAKYARQLERSGCTQVTEAQGCDITKTKAENAKAGFVTESAAPKGGDAGANPYAGQWVAKSDAGATVATIRINKKEQVWVNGKRVKAKRSDGGLVFRAGKLSFTIQGDRRLKGEDVWIESDAGTRGPIVAE
jgi:hypothetical protein